MEKVLYRGTSGEVPQYYVENSHPAIIPAEVFDYVQAELARMDGKRRTSKHTIFSGKVFCGECGSIYGSKVWHSTDKYRRTIWRCNAKYENGTYCTTPHLTQDQLKQAFVEAFNAVLDKKEELLQAYRVILAAFTDVSRYQRQAEQAEQEHAEVMLLINQSIQKNATVALNQTDYKRYYENFVQRADDAKRRLDEANKTMHQQELKRRKLFSFMNELEKRSSLLTEFDGELWVATVEKVTVNAGTLVFLFKDGKEHTVAF